ncbi:MAG: FAD-dependent oxidoreductase [Actinobacteria bacterium]|nr:FAD-dependent oxidoreductase [Actinomycetota bacterium]
MAKTGTGRAVVIGGGLAGLAAAYRLDRDGWNVLLLEKEQQVGGRCRTTRDGGFQFDTGVQCFRDSYDTTLKTAVSLGLGEKFRIPPWGKGIYYRGKVACFAPRQVSPLKLLPWRALGIKGIVDVPATALPLLLNYRAYNIKLPQLWTRGDSVTAGEFLFRRTTRAYRQAIADPVALYAGGAGLDRLSASAFTVALRATFADRTIGFSSGVGALADALAEEVEVKTGMEAVEIHRRGRAVAGVRARPRGGGRARSYHADLVVCALPAPLVGQVAGKLGRKAQLVIKKTEYSPGIVVNLGFSGEVKGAVGPVLLPAADGFNASWVCTQGSKAVEYAPSGGSLVTVVYAGERASGLSGESDRELALLALGDAGRVYELEGLTHRRSRIDRHPLARPVASPGYAERVRELAAAGSGVKNLLLAGDWTSSPTAEGAMASGFLAAEAAGLRS